MLSCTLFLVWQFFHFISYLFVQWLRMYNILLKLYNILIVKNRSLNKIKNQKIPFFFWWNRIYIWSLHYSFTNMPNVNKSSFSKYYFIVIKNLAYHGFSAREINFSWPRYLRIFPLVNSLIKNKYLIFLNHTHKKIK